VEGGENGATTFAAFGAVLSEAMIISPFHAISYPFLSDVKFKVFVGVRWGLPNGLVSDVLRAPLCVFVSRSAHHRLLSQMRWGPSVQVMLIELFEGAVRHRSARGHTANSLGENPHNT